MADQQQHGNNPLVERMLHDYLLERRLRQRGIGALQLCRHKELPHLRKVLKVTATDMVETPDPSTSPSARANSECTSAFVFDRPDRDALVVTRGAGDA